MNMENMEMAIADYEMVLHINPDITSLRPMLCRMMFDFGRFDKAIGKEENILLQFSWTTYND